MRANKDKVFSYSVFGLTLILLGVLAYNFGFTFSWDLVFFGVLVALCELFPIKFPNYGTVAITSLIVIATWLRFGPLETAFVILFGCIWPDLKKDLHVILFNCGQFLMSVCLASLSYTYISRVDPTHFPIPIFAFLISIFVFHMVNTWLVSISVSFSSDSSPFKIWSSNVRWGLLNYLSIAVLAVVFYELYARVGIPGVILLLVPLIIARQTYQYYIRLTGAYTDTVTSLVKAVETKDRYTSGHSERVSDISAKIAKEIGLSEEEMQSLKRIAALHDIGKIGVPNRILTKPSSLSDEEYDLIKEHPKIGAQILKNVEFLQDYIPAVYYHHERMDGSGYNSGLSGENIPLYARIIAIADAYDAMTSDRAYRQALNRQEVVKEFEKAMGTQFDPKLVRALFKVLDINVDEKEKEDTIQGTLIPSSEET